MYLINPILTDNQLNSDGYNHLLRQIDRSILTLSVLEYQNQTLGFKDPVDYNLYDTLCIYREILLDILMGCTCQTCTHMVLIFSKVKKLTQNGTCL